MVNSENISFNRRKTTAEVWDGIFKKKREASSKITIFEKLYNTFNARRVLINKIKKCTHNFFNSSVLDIGCGDGTVSLKTINAHNKVILADISINSLKIATETYKKHNRHVVGINADIFSIPFQSESFDLILMVGYIQFFYDEDKINALKEFKRVLKKSGTLILTYPSTSGKIAHKCKEYARKKGFYAFGPEEEIHSIKSFIKNVPGLTLYKDESFGFLIQLYYLSYLTEKLKFGKIFAKRAILVISLGINIIFWFLNYLLLGGISNICVIKRSDNNKNEIK